MRKTSCTSIEPEQSSMETRMDVLPESETPTKRQKRDVNRRACAREPLPKPFPEKTSIKIYLNEDGSFPPHKPKFERGTTALGFAFQKGIIVAVDHASKSSEWPKNVVKLNSHMLATISGGSEFLLEDLQKMCYRQELLEGRKTSVAKALKWLSMILAGHKEELSIGILIVAWGKSGRGLYRMNGKGEVVKDDVLATGCGRCAATLVRADYIPESHPKSHDLRTRYMPRLRPSISVTEAADLAKRTICMVAYSAPLCGDTVSVFHVGTDGCERLIEDDIEEWQKANIESPRMRFEIIGKGWSDAVA